MKFSVLTSLLTFAALAPLASAELYGLSSTTPGTVYTLDTATGAATPVVDLSNDILASIVDIEFLGGTAYACDILTNDGFSFGTIDLNTGAFTALSQQDGSANWFGLAAKESANILYTVDIDDNNTLKSITPAGVTTSIGGVGFNVYGMTYDSLTDTLYATDGQSLYTLDQTTAAPTLIGTFGGPNDGSSDLAFDPTTNTLYLNSFDTLYTVDQATGLASLVGPNNAGGVPIDGLGNLAAPVPEPTSMAAIGLGLLALIRRRR